MTTPPVYGMFAMGAALLHNTNPELAAHLQWAWDKAGRAPFRGHGLNNLGVLNALYLGQDIPARQPPQYQGKQVPGYGFVFHKNWGGPGEWMVFGKAGPASGHYHPSDGAIQLYAYDKPLIIGYGKYPYLITTWRYSTVRLHGRSNWSRGTTGPVFTSLICDAAAMFIPVRNVSKDREKTIAELARSGQFYQSTWDAVMDIDPSWFRRFVLFNRVDGYLVVYDQAGPLYRSDWFTHVLSISAKKSGRTIHFTGRLGVDLDLRILVPPSAQPMIQGPIATQFAALIKAKKLRWNTRYIDQQVVRISAKPLSDYLVVYHPRNSQDSPPPLAIESVGPGWTIKGPTGKSIIVCQGTPVTVSQGDAAITAERGAIVRSGANSALLLSPVVPASRKVNW